MLNNLSVYPYDAFLKCLDSYGIRVDCGDECIGYTCPVKRLVDGYTFASSYVYASEGDFTFCSFMLVWLWWCSPSEFSKVYDIVQENRKIARSTGLVCEFP